MTSSQLERVFPAIWLRRPTISLTTSLRATKVRAAVPAATSHVRTVSPFTEVSSKPMRFSGWAVRGLASATTRKSQAAVPLEPQRGSRALRFPENLDLGDTMTASWSRDLVLYEVYVRGFFDSNGDGIGDLRGLTEKLPYIRDLGVGAIWLLPIFPSPLRDDGYDVADYRDIHPDLGTLDDFRDLLRVAHTLSLRVIIDLVLNHTSDQHTWFQEARRGPENPFHSYYVWSPTPDRYADVRRIFVDVEPSNWTFDDSCGAYYWHRFYAHQPDLNYDDPRVPEEMLAVARFWLDLGVDGFRVDAVPYLFEREGLGGENLPETHAFLKRLRKVVDEYDPPRVLIAEANQPVEELIRYFGEGDEFHMAFHFPLMPRLFLAIHQEVSAPIIDILERAARIPDDCQWVMFLRNHDELTLEMLTDDERSYLWEHYASELPMRLNLGIRRRLWPLLSGGRRQVELLHGLILSLPGCAVLYYGDELGMGDNCLLGDRMGVRTPMQWTPDMNAGFSTADPQRLYAPVITEPEYHFAGHNVRSRDQQRTSFLNWLRRMIKVHRADPVFRGRSMRIVSLKNQRVLAFVRESEAGTVLCVNNLSRFVQPALVDLSEWLGRTPVEIIGGARLPRIYEPQYFLTLGPHSLLWLRLEDH
jgi:maltose alpha-D-glucosyltransferase/alpha-amylase